MKIEARYRTLWRRVFAGLIDFVVLMPLLGICFSSDYAQMPPAARVAIEIACSLAMLGYSVLMHWRLGATLGKLATGVRVVGLSETPLSLRQALAREAFNIATAAYGAIPHLVALGSGSLPEATPDPMYEWVTNIFFLLEILTALSNNKRRSIHDFIGGTVVIRAPARHPSTATA